MHCNLHNLPNLEITIKYVSELFALVDCEEFLMIRRPHIIIFYLDVAELEKSGDNYEPEDADRMWVKDVLEAFPDVYFTLKYIDGNISLEKAIQIQKKYQNVVFNFKVITDYYEGFLKDLE